MHTLSSASRTCIASASAVECTATVAIPSSLQARSTRSAISPRLAIRIFSNMARIANGEWRMANGSALLLFTIRYSPFTTRPHSMIINGSPYSTGWPSSNRICVTVPPRGAGIWFMVFIASTISSGSPAFTTLPMSTNGLAVGSGARIGGADHRRGHDARVLRRIADGDRRHGRGGRDRRDRRHVCAASGGHHMRDRLARDAHPQALALDLDLAEAGFVEQLCQLADQVLFAQRFARAWLRFSLLP